jgi:hypothetical protein
VHGSPCRESKRRVYPRRFRCVPWPYPSPVNIRLLRCDRELRTLRPNWPTRSQARASSHKLLQRYLAIAVLATMKPGTVCLLLRVPSLAKYEQAPS